MRWTGLHPSCNEQKVISIEPDTLTVQIPDSVVQCSPGGTWYVQDLGHRHTIHRQKSQKLPAENKRNTPRYSSPKIRYVKAEMSI